jgi:hypothetical protein
VDVGAEVPAALRRHPSVRAVRLVGSRAEGRSHDISDWDFVVETDDFEALARDLPELFASLAPLAEQWDRYAPHGCYMLMFRGPTKVDLLFLDEPRELEPAWAPSPENLAAIDRHFWDWILWLEQKRTGGREPLFTENLQLMFEMMLRPMGVAAEPRSLAEAIDAYAEARGELERRFGVSVPRELEREVRPVVERRQPRA